MARQKKSEVEEEYEVERVVKAKVFQKNSKARRIAWRYFVKWKNYPASQNTWEPESSFDENPDLLARFWKACNVGDRDYTKAKGWALEEEIEPKNKTKPFADLNDSNTETDADAEGESTNEDANASASVVVPSSPKRKRRQPPKTYATPARKRGRPAAKTNGESTSIKPAPSRTSQSRGRASEKKTGDSRRRSSKTSAADRNRRTSKRLSTAKSEAQESEAELEEEEERETEYKIIPKSEVVVEVPSFRRTIRKAYDDETDNDQEEREATHESEEGSDHDSLFSGDGDENTVEPHVPSSTTEPHEGASGPAETLPPVIEPTAPVPATPAPKPAPVEDSRPRRTPIIRSGRPKEAKVKMMEDPDVEKSLQQRVLGKTGGTKQSGAEARTAHGSMEPVRDDASKNPENDTAWGPRSSHSPSKGSNGSTTNGKPPSAAPAPRYKPSLLTFDKGKLQSQRLLDYSARSIPVKRADSGSTSLAAAGVTPLDWNAIEASAGAPLLSAISSTSVNDVEEVSRAIQLDANVETDGISMVRNGENTGVQSHQPETATSISTEGKTGGMEIEMQMEQDLTTREAEPATAEPQREPIIAASVEPRPTAADLLMLSGVATEMDDLPDFQMVEPYEGATNKVKEGGFATPHTDEATGSTSEWKFTSIV